MKKEDLLKFCQYYRGEKKCPFTDDVKFIFWHEERMFISEVLKNPDFLDFWLSIAKEYIEKNKEITNNLTSNKFDIHTKAIILYIENHLHTFMPYNIDIILKY